MSLIGHDDAWREWRAAMAGERMHHAWMLVGPKGTGKGLFARAAAAELVAQAGVPQPPFDHHPDILIPEHPPENKEETKKRDDGQAYKRKRSIPVDEVRALQHRLVTRPTLGPRRAVIFDPADDLEKSASNALLKSLEEPPVGTFFLLVTHRPARLLPTIRSRCRILRFPALTDAEMNRIVAQETPQADSATRAAAIAAAQGSPGAALDFVDQDLGALHRIMQQLVAEGDAQFTLRGELAAQIGARPTRERIQATLDLARAVLAGNLRGMSAAQQARVVDVHAALAQLTAEAPTANFEPGLLAMEIGGLLASAAMPRETA
ncbi:AAA family ATPase [Novosphingobium sp. TH158]|uniref:AAA family ATPase n=1 Tax=Novosphingobium sp. TH158 TaxID=2067455 RepID=UPI000C7D705F|nr:AAA family ATPase [Novosphingobium sp. TH158]PLK25866.1 DNA polymerase III subunit delta' [Novosphingobium sp. TH158]